MQKKFSVVVCVKNNQSNIIRCLKSIKKNKPNEIIVVDGDSLDKTVLLAKSLTKKVFIRKNSNLTKDRQFGINRCKNNIIVMIDSDHILSSKSDIDNMINDLYKFNFDMMQSQLEIYNKKSFMSLAENQSYEVVHNIPGKKKMIGVAPAIYKKKIFRKVKFDDFITKTIDDTDFIYRLKKYNFSIGIGTVKIYQNHDPLLSAYLKKFLWYGIGDGEFIHKNPSQLLNFIFHLIIRYNIIYPIKAIFKLKFLAIFFFWIQSFMRFLGLINYYIKKL